MIVFVLHVKFSLSALFAEMQCNCAMGLMPAVKRAWFTVDCTVYMWNYEDGSVKLGRDGACCHDNHCAYELRTVVS